MLGSVVGKATTSLSSKCSDSSSGQILFNKSKFNTPSSRGIELVGGKLDIAKCTLNNTGSKSSSVTNRCLQKSWGAFYFGTSSDKVCDSLDLSSHYIFKWTTTSMTWHDKSIKRNLGIPVSKHAHDYCRVPFRYPEKGGRLGIAECFGFLRMETKTSDFQTSDFQRICAR